MRQLKLDFNDNNDKVYINNRQEATREDILHVFHALTAYLLAKDFQEHRHPKETLDAISEEINEGLKRFINIDIDPEPDPAEWGLKD